MAQSTITNFYTNRKRSAVEDLKGKTSKIRALDLDIASGYGRAKSMENPSQPSVCIEVSATVLISTEDGASKVKPQLVAAQTTPKPKTPARSTRRTTKVKDPKQADMKMFLQGGKATSKEDAKSELNPSVESSNVIKEEPIEAISNSEKNSATVQETEIKPENGTDVKSTNTSLEKQVIEQPIPIITATEDKASSSVLQETNVNPPEKKESSVEKARKELSLGDIKSKLTRSARLAELKASMARLDEGRQKLKNIEQAKKKLQDSNLPPQLTQFSSIELEVPVSPSKSPMKSPMKSPLKSPLKCLAGSRSPAFQRYASLAQPGTVSLPLPYSYRNLGEFFRCIDQTASQMCNRGEVVTFEKLQSAVQNMTRKAFTMNHLAQVLKVFPESYNLRYEKLRNFGMPSERDKYHLVVSPVVASNPDGQKTAGPTMTGSLLLERRRIFFNNLLDITKKHHQEFLQSLDPPMMVPLESLTRWHPEFAVDQVPAVTPASLPEPPNLEKCVSAKDVLAKQRQLYSCNPRMEKALESVAQSDSPTVPTVKVEVVNPTSTPANPPTSPFKSMQLSSALKGIPKALLEKIRAKEAARAMEAMTRTSAQDKEAVQFGRLPEIARILRNVFVTEKKSTLPLDTVLEKVGNSYRSALSPRELDEHLRLLAKSVPGWLTFKHLLKNEYLELSKRAEMSKVMTKLQNLANAK